MSVAGVRVAEFGTVTAVTGVNLKRKLIGFNVASGAQCDILLYCPELN